MLSTDLWYAGRDSRPCPGPIRRPGGRRREAPIRQRRNQIRRLYVSCVWTSIAANALAPMPGSEKVP